VTVPATTVTPGPFTVKVPDARIDAEFIGSLKVAVIF
jgi:hypothetical protein